VRHTDATRADLQAVMESGAYDSVSDAVAASLSLHAAYLNIPTGMTVRVTHPSRRRTRVWDKVKLFDRSSEIYN
jgi:hypothetical protein